MFTGLIQAIGVVQKISETAEGRLLRIQCPGLINEIAVDDSIATNGVCLTATAIEHDGFIAHAIHTTLEKTSIGSLIEGERVNLELALRANNRLGGHMVQGHVNAIGSVTAIDVRGENWQMQVAFPENLRKYMILEGSITLDGISLTIAELGDEHLMVSIIPHTLQNTTLGDKNLGSLLNIEVDIMAKYIENFLRFDKTLANAWTHLNPNT
jgi:riboflavin synthase